VRPVRKTKVRRKEDQDQGGRGWPFVLCFSGRFITEAGVLLAEKGVTSPYLKVGRMEDPLTALPVSGTGASDMNPIWASRLSKAANYWQRDMTSAQNEGKKKGTSCRSFSVWIRGGAFCSSFGQVRYQDKSKIRRKESPLTARFFSVHQCPCWANKSRKAGRRIAERCNQCVA
jgi:hypothetical protein